jgi:SAM-dependent methyltransferase
MPTFLHVGCGHFTKTNTTAAFRSDAWQELRFDIDPAVNPDFQGSMTDMSAVKTASVDAIYSAHNIEHLYPHEVPVALREFLRVLRPDGFVLIVCPDLQSVCELVAEDGLEDPAYMSAVGPITPADILYGHRPALLEGNLYMAHRYGFTLKTLKAALSEAGFSSFAGTRNRRAFELWALATVSAMDGFQLEALAKQHFPSI